MGFLLGWYDARCQPSDSPGWLLNGGCLDRLAAFKGIAQDTTMPAADIRISVIYRMRGIKL